MCLKATFVGEPDAGNPHVRFDERDVETGHGEAINLNVKIMLMNSGVLKTKRKCE